MCFYQSLAFCTCCKKRIYRSPDDDMPFRLRQCCTSLHIFVSSYEKCLTCIDFDCEFECESGHIPNYIYCVPNTNKVLMFFKATEIDDDYCDYIIYSRCRLPC